MTRGTTPTYTFTLPFSAESIDALAVTFTQNDATVIEKTLSDCTASGQTVAVTLTQADTLAFSDDAEAEIQLAIRVSGAALRSQLIRQEVYPASKNGAI